MQSLSGERPREPDAAEERKPRSRKNLVARVSGQLRQAIQSGDLRPGDKLPSEAGLTKEYDVSRTVIREAIASLRADGLVEPRHGVGVFVLDKPKDAAPAFQIVDPSRISSIIEVLELRAAVEIEAAGLAATRRSPAQEEAIWECYYDLDELVAAGKPTTDADFALHLAIADATNNPRFHDFLEMLGHHVIPRAFLRSSANEPTPQGYLQQIQAEHWQIAEAISARDEEGARDAVRTHLKGSQKRYRDLMRRS